MTDLRALADADVERIEAAILWGSHAPAWLRGDDDPSVRRHFGKLERALIRALVRALKKHETLRRETTAGSSVPAGESSEVRTGLPWR